MTSSKRKMRGFISAHKYSMFTAIASSLNRHKPSNKQRLCGGFTLIELLVVISIISLLVAILLPALAAARQAARQIQCASNQRQDVTALLMYAHDHEGWFPVVGWGSGTTIYQDNHNWPRFSSGGSRTSLVTYFGLSANASSSEIVGGLKALLCPNSVSHVPSNYLARGGVSTTYHILAGRGDHGPNWQYMGWAAYSHRWPGTYYGSAPHGTVIPRLRLAGTKAAVPSEQPAIADGGNSPGNKKYGSHPHEWYTHRAFWVPNNHESGRNIGFLDGHVKFYKYVSRANAEHEINFYYNSLTWGTK